jgi:Sap, sulfolipid-1-addressing protein
VSSSALASVVVLGIGCAANPWGIMIAILLLDARRGHGIVWTYVLAWTGAISVVLVALLAGLGAVFESARTARTPRYSATYPLVIAAAGEILRADTGSAETAALVVLFVVLGSSSVAGVAALGTFAPSRSAAFLERMRAWVTAHNRAVITTIVLVLGGYLAARGLEGLL